MINKCNCYSPYQDRVYGKGNRVFNQMTGSSKEGGKKGVARCTVCSHIIYSTAGVVNQVRLVPTKVEQPLQLVTHRRLERGHEYHRR